MALAVLHVPHSIESGPAPSVMDSPPALDHIPLHSPLYLAPARGRSSGLISVAPCALWSLWRINPPFLFTSLVRVYFLTENTLKMPSTAYCYNETYYTVSRQRK